MKAKKDRKQDLINQLAILEISRSIVIKRFYEKYSSVIEELVDGGHIKVGEDIVLADCGLALQIVPKTMDVVIYKKYDVKRTKCHEDDKATLAMKTAVEAGLEPCPPDMDIPLLIEELGIILGG